MTDEADLLHRRGLKLGHLHLIAELAETGQLGLAALRLGMAQPAASRLLAEMERIAGQELCLRTGRGMVLTPAGEALAQRAARVRLEMRDAARELAELGHGGTGQVRIGAVTAPALEIVLPVLRAFRLTHPGVTVDVAVSPSETLCEQLMAGHIDFALGRLPASGPQRELLAMQEIGDEPVTLLVRRDHALLSGPAPDPARLLEFDWVIPGGDSPLGRAVLARLDQLGLPAPARRLSTASFLLTLALIQQSNAIAPLARAVADQFARGPDAPYAEVPVDLGIVVAPYGLLTRQGATLPPAARLVSQAMLAAARRAAARDSATERADGL